MLADDDVANAASPAQPTSVGGAETEQAAILAARLRSGTLDCAICTEPVEFAHQLWHCRRCFGIQHLPCVVFWANSHGTLRCPLCQQVQSTETLVYRCFCGKVKDPQLTASTPTPGTCGATCEKRRPDPHCSHLCAAPCHPGPCAPCPLTREQGCYCGADEKSVGCSSGIDGYSCGEVCGRELNCGRHYCQEVCHKGACSPCKEVIQATCFCGRHTKAMTCDRDTTYGCGALCAKAYDCGLHHCVRPCHDGPCPSVCQRTVERQVVCNCGKSKLADLSAAARTKCTDPIPSCGKPCGKELPCGHACHMLCHDGPCGPCAVMITVRCRCLTQKFEVPCFTSQIRLKLVTAARSGTAPGAAAASDSDETYDREPWLRACQDLGLRPKLLPESFPPRCKKRCTEKLSCSRHSCDTVCCENPDHTCYRICRKRAPCGLHECGQLCHKGPCPPCSFTSYDPLFCRCGKTVLEPPIPCGTPPPRCNHPCSTARACGHPANHPCHMDGACPPCVVPTEKECASHLTRMSWFLPCHYAPPSCGKICSKLLPCRHGICDKVCHIGACPCATCAAAADRKPSRR